jgi:CHAT domain-containing protein
VALALVDKSERHLLKIAGPGMKSVYAPTRAEILRGLGRYDEAETALRAYLRTQQQRLGPRHPIVGSAHLLLTHLFMAARKPAAAEDSLARGLDIAERELALILATGSEADHGVYFHRNAYLVDVAIQLHTRDAPHSARAAELAMTTVLRRKGRILDASAGAMAALRGRLSPDDAQVLERLDETRAKLAKLILAGPDATGPQGYGKAVAALDEEARELEEFIRKRSAAYRVISQPIDLASVQAMLPGDARLVEIVNYQPYDRRFDLQHVPPRRYGAYVVARRGAPTFVDLGEVAAIDVAVEEFRTAVADPDDERVIARGRALYDLTLAKLAPKLRGANKIALAPDGQLNLVPFAALVEPGGGFVVQHLTITYLTSGRDLLRRNVSARPHGKPVIIADPAFDGTVVPAATAPSELTRGLRSRDLSIAAWRPLPGTRQEGEAIQQLLAGAQLLRGEQATEGALKAVDAPSILHIATHGFFLTAPPAGAIDGDGSGAGLGRGDRGSSPALLVLSIGAPPSADVRENPLLRSGLALAGANTLRSGSYDGIVTALEASGLNLWGTQLVVLSACETGIGKVRNGEGIYGLRRALIIAGAESLVMSLWQVDDRATRDLMTRFYRRLEQGDGRSEALRGAQLELLATVGYRHPYFWAAFQPAGDSSPIKEWR